MASPQVTPADDFLKLSPEAQGIVLNKLGKPDTAITDFSGLSPEAKGLVAQKLFEPKQPTFTTKTFGMESPPMTALPPVQPPPKPSYITDEANQALQGTGITVKPPAQPVKPQYSYSDIPHPLARFGAGIVEGAAGQVPSTREAILQVLNPGMTGQPQGMPTPPSASIHDVGDVVQNFTGINPVEPALRAIHGDIPGAIGEAGMQYAQVKGGQKMSPGLQRGANTLQHPLETASGVTGAIARGLGGGSGAERMAKAPSNAEVLGPHTNADINSFAESKGINLLPGQATESRPVKAIQAVGERAITPSGEKLQTALEAQQAALQESVGGLKNQLASTAGADAAGKAVQAEVVAKGEALKAQARKDFDAFREATGDIPVDFSKPASAFNERLLKYGLEANEVPKTLREVLGKGSEPVTVNGQQVDPRELPEQVRAVLGLNKNEADMARAQTLRSNALDIARTSSDGRLRAFSRGVAKDIDQAMSDAADKAGVTEQWRRANTNWRTYEQAFNNSKSPLMSLGNAADAAKALQRITAPGTIGGSLENLRALKAQSVNLGPVKRLVLENIEKKNFAVPKSGKTLGGYSTQFLNELYSPEELRQIQLHAHVARKVGYEMNPSGTSNVQGAEGQLHGIISGSTRALVAPAAARLTMSPAFKRGVVGKPRGGLPFLPPNEGPAPMSGGGLPFLPSPSGAGVEANMAAARQAVPSTANLPESAQRQMATTDVNANQHQATYLMDFLRDLQQKNETGVPPEVTQKFGVQSESGLPFLSRQDPFSHLIVPPDDVAGSWLHGSTQGDITPSEKAPKHNFFGRGGIYLTGDEQSARSYALGKESTPGENPKILTVNASPQSVFDAREPLGAAYQPLADAVRSAAANKGLKDVGLRTLDAALARNGADSTLEHLASEGISVTAFLPEALRSLGFDAIKQGRELVVLDPSKVHVTTSEGATRLEPVPRNEVPAERRASTRIVNEATQQAEKAEKNVKSRAQKQGGFANLGMLSGAVPSKKVSPLGFFSKAEEVAQSKLPNAGSGESFANALRNNGVKPDEMKWSGLDDLLAKPKVTKQEVLDHLAQNNVQVQEVTKSEKQLPDMPWLETKSGYNRPMWVTNVGRTDYSIVKGEGTYSLSKGDNVIGYHDTLEEAQQAARQDAAGKGKNAPKFAAYQLPGGSNYRELLLTLPGNPESRGPWLVYDAATGHEVATVPTQAEASAWVHSRPGTTYTAAKGNKDLDFTGGHFDEPNVLAHVRFNDRTSPDGKKTLFIEELQSDWHQKGRREGYRSGNWAVWRDGKKLADGFPSREAANEWAKTQGLDPRYDFTASTLEGGVPDAPFKNTWHELAMKRMLRYASENGYDRLAWTTGEQQAGRYDLSKQVNAVQWAPKTGAVRVEMPDGTMQFVKDGGVTADKLPDYVGKDAAQKLVSQPEAGMWREIRGNDLKVGGEGMKGFYDKILPDFLNKYGKKWGARVQDTPMKVGTAGLGKEDYEVRQTRTGWGVFDGDVELQTFARHGESAARAYADELRERNKVGMTPVHSLDITPAMKKSVMEEGQPLFTVPPFLIPAAAGAGVAAAGYAANQKKKAKAHPLAFMTGAR